MNLSASDIASTAAQLFYLNTDIREIQCWWYSKVLGVGCGFECSSIKCLFTAAAACAVFAANLHYNRHQL